MRQSRHVVNRHMVQLENKSARYAKSQNQLHSAMKHAGDESVVLGRVGELCRHRRGRSPLASRPRTSTIESKARRAPKATTTVAITAIITQNSPALIDWQRHCSVQTFPATQLSPCKQNSARMPLINFHLDPWTAA